MRLNNNALIYMYIKMSLDQNQDQNLFLFSNFENKNSETSNHETSNHKTSNQNIISNKEKQIMEQQNKYYQMMKPHLVNNIQN